MYFSGRTSPQATTLLLVTTNSPASPASALKGRSRWLFVRDVAIILVIALLASLLIKTFLVRSFYIPSGSMEHTLDINDRILVNQLEPDLIPVSRGDVVVFKDPGGWLPSAAPVAAGNPIAAAGDWTLKVIGIVPDDANDHLVKRVIGIPGDHVVCCNPMGQLTVNGEPLDESPYIGSTTASQIEFDVIVPAQSLWVMGDNRNNSEDSRFHQDEPGKGFVPLPNVTGRAFVTTWPVNRWTLLDNYPATFAGIPTPAP